MRKVHARWTYLAAGCAFVALLVVLLVRVSLSGDELSDERAHLVLRNALAVANPDYEIAFDWARGSWKRTERGRELSMAFSEQGSGPEAHTTWTDALVLSHSGDVRLPVIPRSRMAAALEEFGAPARAGGAGESSALLKELPDGLQVEGVVELRAPLDLMALRGLWTTNIDVFLLSGARPQGKPLSWDTGAVYCGSRGFDTCAAGTTGRVPATEQFRRWVSLLREDDRPYLERVGLELSELRAAADEAKVHGWAMTASPGTFRALARDPRVRRVSVVSVTPEDG
ncbi:hypothetical protein [Nonomuraea sp. NPDC050691]|uniref:hypothetical protein n=1 Tax=Nonomuraea sp. NPDC050691 TaxID=3155661 RepID=UPI00340DF100